MCGTLIVQGRTLLKERQAAREVCRGRLEAVGDKWAEGPLRRCE